MPNLKIAYAFVGAGNGHAGRAREVIPHLQQYGDVDIFLSGTDCQLSLPSELTRHFHGLIFHLNGSGGVDYWRTIKDFRIPTLISDIHNFEIDDYDVLINDFEPVTAWKARFSKVPCISLSHQAAFASEQTPRPKHRDWMTEIILRQYAPSDAQIGFHFAAYDDFIHSPVIRREVRDLSVSNEGHVTVYLPAYDDKSLTDIFHAIPQVRWEVFSKQSNVDFKEDNVSVRSIENEAYLDSLASCDGLLTGGGFEAPAEALFLGKRLMMVPQRRQYEQRCNAEAARRLGVEVISRVDRGAIETIGQWATTSRHMTIRFPDETAEVVGKAVEKALDIHKARRRFRWVATPVQHRS